MEEALWVSGGHARARSRLLLCEMMLLLFHRVDAVVDSKMEVRAELSVSA